MTTEATVDLQEVYESEPPGSTILIVDDDETQVSALSTRLEQQGYRTLAAFDGKTATALTYESRPDLILLDLGLPDADGLHICQRLADDPLTCAIPIIILTGLERADLVRSSRAAGCKFFVRKPYDPNALLTLIEHSLREGADW